VGRRKRGEVEALAEFHSPGMVFGGENLEKGSVPKIGIFPGGEEGYFI